MSYIVIKVYSFECDWPGCNVTNIDICEGDLRAALKTLRKTEHWTVDKDGRHLCPKHPGSASTEYRQQYERLSPGRSAVTQVQGG